MGTSPFSIAGLCLVVNCDSEQAPDSTLPLCFEHRLKFQRSPAYRVFREATRRGQRKEASVALAVWVESQESPH